MIRSEQKRLAIGVGAFATLLGGAYLISRGREPSSESAQPSSQRPGIVPKPRPVGLRPSSSYPVEPPPTGYRYAINLPPGAHEAAWELIDEPYGTTRIIHVGDREYLARVEPHYDKGQLRVDHWHKGVSLFEQIV